MSRIAGVPDLYEGLTICALVVVLVVVVVVVVVVMGSCRSWQAGSPWPGLGGAGARTSQSSSMGPASMMYRTAEVQAPTVEACRSMPQHTENWGGTFWGKISDQNIKPIPEQSTARGSQYSSG